MPCQPWSIWVCNFICTSLTNCRLLWKECDSMLCIDCISEKGMHSEGHHQKIELLQSAPSRMPLMNVSFMPFLFLFFLLWTLFLLEMTSINLHNSSSHRAIRVLLCNGLLIWHMAGLMIEPLEMECPLWHFSMYASCKTDQIAVNLKYKCPIRTHIYEAPIIQKMQDAQKCNMQIHVTSKTVISTIRRDSL